MWSISGKSRSLHILSLCKVKCVSISVSRGSLHYHGFGGGYSYSSGGGPIHARVPINAHPQFS